MHINIMNKILGRGIFHCCYGEKMKQNDILSQKILRFEGDPSKFTVFWWVKKYYFILVLKKDSDHDSKEIW